jgi:hypothetical protein
MSRHDQFHNMILNGFELDMLDCSIEQDSKSKDFLGNLSFELWIYNAAAVGFWYHERFFGLWFNLTRS